MVYPTGTGATFVIVPGYDSGFWSGETSPQIVTSGILQVLHRTKKNGVNGVLVFESLFHDHSCTRNNIAQVKAVLAKLKVTQYSNLAYFVTNAGSDLARDRALVDSILIEELHLTSALAVQAQEKINSLCLVELGGKLVALEDVETEAVKQNDGPEPLYFSSTHPQYLVVSSKASGTYALANEGGFIRCNELESKSIRNNGMVIVDGKIQSNHLLNSSVIKAKAAEVAGHNFGSIISDDIALKEDLKSTGVLSCTRITKLKAGPSYTNVGQTIVHTCEVESVANSGIFTSIGEVKTTGLSNSGRLSLKDIKCAFLSNDGSTRVNGKCDINGVLSNNGPFRAGVVVR